MKKPRAKPIYAYAIKACGNLQLETAGPKLFAEKVNEMTTQPTRDAAEGAGDENPFLEDAERWVSFATPKPAPDAMRVSFEFWATSDHRGIQPLEGEERTDANNHYYETDTDNAAFIGWKAALSAPVPSPDGTSKTWWQNPDPWSQLGSDDDADESPSGTGAAEPGKRWYVGAQNDGLFIVNAEPRPSNDHPWHDGPNGPTVALNVTELPLAKAQKIVDVMNALTIPPVRGDRSILADQYADYSAACDKVRREMRALILERDDPKLSSLYYRAVTLSEHEAARRTLLSLAVEREAGVKMGDASTKGDSK